MEISILAFSMLRLPKGGRIILFLFLQDDQGHSISFHDLLVNHIIGFYTNLFGTTRDTLDIDCSLMDLTHTVSSEINDMLSACVTASEIKTIVFGMGNNKAPRPDVYNAHFYKKSWALTGELVVKAVDEFFRNRKLLKQVNITSVSLISKVDHPLQSYYKSSS